MKHIELITSVQREQPRYGYILQISEAPAWKVIRGQLYHWWDMHFRWFHRNVGRIVDKWTSRHGVADKDGLFWLPYEAKQDCRCFELNHHPVVFEATITEEEYLKLGGEYTPS